MKKIILCMFSFILFFGTSCKNKLNNDASNENEKKFKEEIKKAISLVENDGNINFPASYILIDEYISGFDSNNEQKNYILGDNEISYGIMYIDENNKIYASFENSEFCAIKDYDSENFDVYSISEVEKCHKLYSSSKDIVLLITPIDMETNQIYSPETISNGYIKIFLYENIIDDKAVNYIWYRNGEVIDNDNNTYIIEKNYEDAIYYVEMKSFDGQIIESNKINIKINRNV